MKELAPETRLHLFLARCPLRNRTGPKKVITASCSPEEISEHYLRQFSPNVIMEAMVDSQGNPIDFNWYIKQLLQLLDSSRTASNTKLEVLRELKGYMKACGIQFRPLATEIEARLDKEGVEKTQEGDLRQPEMAYLSDPFGD